MTDSWPVTMRYCAASSRRRSSATTHRSPRCREILCTWTMNKGDLYETHIGPDGKADSETHYSDHGTPTLHDNPHTHDIYWDDLALTPVGLNTLGKHMAEKGDGFL